LKQTQKNEKNCQRRRFTVLQSSSVRYNCEKVGGGRVATFTNLTKSPEPPFFTKRVRSATLFRRGRYLFRPYF
jgi:hypothetical protein